MTDPIKEEAEYLAKENREADPEIGRIFWFPDEKVVRLVELHPDAVANLDGRLTPFYFRPSPQDGLRAWSGVALIRPEELGRLDLPEDWGSWDDAVELVPATSKNGTGRR